MTKEKKRKIIKKKTVRKNVKKRALAPKRAKRPTVSRKKKSTVKKPAKATTPKPTVIAPVNSILLGYVEDYFAKIGVISLILEKPVSVGARIQVLGHTTNFEQTLDSMQIDHQPVNRAEIKDGIGLKVNSRARKGDHVYLLLS